MNVPDTRKMISEAIAVAKLAGLDGIAPVELSLGGNLIVHLAPHPIVARIAVVRSRDEAEDALASLAQELRIARHLHDRNVPVLLPSDRMEASLYALGDTWMSCWNYVPPTALPPLSPEDAAARIDQLSHAMRGYRGELPHLGVWERTARSAERLTGSADPRVQALLTRFADVDRQMRRETELFPCHGDAHAGNLLPSPEGWIWADFEDASLMPAFWDKASFVCNRALFGGMHEPVFSYIVSRLNDSGEREAFAFALTARVLMSVLGNLDFALAGSGDLPFAMSQLERAEACLAQVSRMNEG